MPRRRRSSRAFRRKLGGTIRLGSVLAILIGVNIYVFFYSSGSLKQVSEAAQLAAVKAPEPAAIAAPGAPAVAPVAPATPAVKARQRARHHEGTLKEHEGIGAVLRREGLAPADTDAALRALQPLMNFKKDLRGGQTYVVAVDATGRLESFELRAAPGVAYRVTRGADGKLAGERTVPASAAAKRHGADTPR